MRRIVTRLVAAALICLGAAGLCAGCASDADVVVGSMGEVAEGIVADAGNRYALTLGFAGDICFSDDEDCSMQRLIQAGSDSITDGIDARFVELMNGMDLMWINNEFCYSDRGEPLEGKAYTFRSSPYNVHFLRDLGIDVAGLANNHVYDYGEDAFTDTLSTLEGAGIPYVGAGRNAAAAYAPVYLEAEGLKIAYVAASRAEHYAVLTPEATYGTPGIAWCYDDTLFLDAIREAAANADYVIALPHWGTEHSIELEEGQAESGHAYIDAGADAVIGAHPHILQGIEYYNGKPILYSLGNFWFDWYDIDTLVAELRITGKRGEDGKASLEGADVQLVLYPGTQSDAFTAWADTDEWRSSIFRNLEDISYGIAIDGEGVVRPAEYAM